MIGKEVLVRVGLWRYQELGDFWNLSDVGSQLEEDGFEENE